MSEVSHHSFRYGSRDIAYELSFKERKTLGIRVYPNCLVKVIAPLDTTQEKLREKLQAKAPWIIKQQLEFLSYQPLTPPRRFVNGESHLYLGRKYKLRLEPSDTNEVKLKHGRLRIYTRGEMAPNEILARWYKQKAEVHFRETLKRVLPQFSRFKIDEPILWIRTMPTRWGSCTPKGKVILNPELVKAPKACIEYVVVHELCHLVHHHHNRAFYELQQSIMPDWQKWKEKLERVLV